MTDDVRRLIEYRFRQARETLQAGQELIHAAHYRDGINRAYYAMFYGALRCRRKGSLAVASTPGC